MNPHSYRLKGRDFVHQDKIEIDVNERAVFIRTQGCFFVYINSDCFLNRLDGEDLDESTFTTFYNKLINMTAQERLTEEYTPEGDPAYTFIFKDTDGKETTVKYYEYDTNFYAAVVEDKVYLVNKMNVKDLDEAYQKMVNPDTEDAEESTSDTATEEN